MRQALTEKLMAPPGLAGVRRALFIQPHPDDDQIAAGGLMAKLVSRGAQVWELTVTDDRLDCPAKQMKDGRTVRQREAEAAQASLGVQNAGFLGFEDKTSATAEQISEAIVPVLRALRPDAVFSVDPTLANECHRDHVKVGWAVRYAVMDAAWDRWPRLPDCEKRRDAWQVKVLGQYFAGAPNTTVDITEFYDAKMRALRCHTSQLSPGLLLACDLQASWFGARAGFARGEAFTLYSYLQLHCFALPIGTAGDETAPTPPCDLE